MNDKFSDNQLRVATVKNEATRRRWELFHRAIAMAKQSNADAMDEADKLRRSSSSDASEPDRGRVEPLLSIAR